MEPIQSSRSDVDLRIPWNKGKLVAAKPPLRMKHVWSIRSQLQAEGRIRRIRDLALFNIAFDSKLRGCDVVSLKVEDVAPHGHTADRATVRQKKTGHAVRFELTEQTREAVDNYLKATERKSGEFLFGGRRDLAKPMSPRQYARLVAQWIGGIGLDSTFFGTHSLRRTKATPTYRRTGNLRAVQLLLDTGRPKPLCAILGSRWMTPWRSPNKSTSDVPGQSRHALPLSSTGFRQ